MGLTKERKIFLGLAGVAAIALIADQGIFGTQGANADQIPVDSSPITGILPDTPLLVDNSPAAKVLLDRLSDGSNADSNDSLGAIFSLTKLIESHESDSEEIGNEISTESFALIPPTAQDLPSLSAVMPTKHGGGAVLSGKILRVGQVDADGYRLIDVHRRSVIVERDGVQYTIEIPRLTGN